MASDGKYKLLNGNHGLQDHDYYQRNLYNETFRKIWNKLRAEIGCIHTLQGYDLNYVGVIIGKDLRYNAEKKCIESDKRNYFDQQGKSGVADDPELLTQYLKNIYLTLMTRGIKGTYVYVCDDALREFMRKDFC